MLHLPVTTIDIVFNKMNIAANVISPVTRMRDLCTLREPFLKDAAKEDPNAYLKSMGYIKEDGNLSDELKTALSIIFQPDKCYVGDYFSEEKRKSFIYAIKGNKTVRIELIDLLFVISFDAFEALARNELHHMVEDVAKDEKATVFSEVLVNKHSHTVAVKNQHNELFATVLDEKLNNKGKRTKANKSLYKYNTDSNGIVAVSELACYEANTGTDGVIKTIFKTLKNLYSKENILRTIVTYIASFGVAILLQVLFPIHLRVGRGIALQTVISYTTYVLLTQLVVNIIYNIRKGETNKRIRELGLSLKAFVIDKNVPLVSRILCGVGTIICLVLALFIMPWQFSMALGITFITAAIAGNNSRLLMYKRKITKKYLDFERGRGLVFMGAALLIGAILAILQFANPKNTSETVKDNSYVSEDAVNNKKNNNVNTGNKNEYLDDYYADDSDDESYEEDDEDLTNVQLFFKKYGDIPGPSTSIEEAGYYYAMASIYMDCFDFDVVKDFFTETSDDAIYEWFNTGHGGLEEMEYTTYITNVVSGEDPYVEVGVYKYDIPANAFDCTEIYGTSPIYVPMKYTSNGYRMCINDVAEEEILRERYESTRTHKGNFYASLGYVHKDEGDYINITDYPFSVPGIFYHQIVEIYMDDNNTMHMILFSANQTDKTICMEGFEAKVEDYSYSFGYIAEINTSLSYEIAPGSFDLLDIAVYPSDLATTTPKHLEAEYYNVYYSTK